MYLIFKISLYLLLRFLNHYIYKQNSDIYHVNPFVQKVRLLSMSRISCFKACVQITVQTLMSLSFSTECLQPPGGPWRHYRWFNVGSLLESHFFCSFLKHISMFYLLFVNNQFHTNIKNFKKANVTFRIKIVPIQPIHVSLGFDNVGVCP